jgi:hypothetical protein
MWENETTEHDFNSSEVKVINNEVSTDIRYHPNFTCKRKLNLPVPFLIQGETIIVGTRTPSLSNLKKDGAGPVFPSGLGILT